MWSYTDKWCPVSLFLLENEEASTPVYLGRSTETSYEGCVLSPFFNLSDRTRDTQLFNHKIYPMLRAWHFLRMAFVWLYPTHTCCIFTDLSHFVYTWNRVSSSKRNKSTTMTGLPARRCIFRDRGMTSPLAPQHTQGCFWCTTLSAR